MVKIIKVNLRYKLVFFSITLLTFLSSNVKPHTTKVACFLLPQSTLWLPFRASDCVSVHTAKIQYLGN